MSNSSQQLTFQEEWKGFFGERINLERIEKDCLSGKLRGSHVRSIIWRILLRSLPLERDEWCSILSRTRNAYDKLKSELITNPREQTSGLDPNVSNPLSLGDENPWQKYFADCELRECINRDVERTCPELQYFKAKEVRNMMSDILFIYAKQHPDIAYRQGMHEILATLIFVLNYDHQAFAHLMEQKGFKDLPTEELKILSAVNNQSFLEHDSFDVFTQLMMMLERWYVASDEGSAEHSSDTLGNNDKLLQIVPFTGAEDVVNPTSDLIVKLRSIMKDILAVIDPELYRHLLKLQIVPQIYGIRWLRLLFGREFPIHDLLFIWDAILAFRPAPSLVDYIFVAMLEYIRNLMIGQDYSTTLQYLMRYPPVADAHSLIQFALHIKSPKKYEQPRIPNVTNFQNITVAGITHPNRGKDFIEPRIAMGKFKQMNSMKEPSSPRKIANSMAENKQQHGDNKSFVAKIVDTISDRNTNERGLIRSPVNYNKGGHMVITVPDETVQLLQEQVSCLQSRLNDMDMMASVVKQRIDVIVDEKLPKIVGNDDLKNAVAEELRSIRLQIGNATQPDANNHAEMAGSSSTRGNVYGFATANDVIEVGNELPALTVQPRQHRAGSSLVPRRRASRMETEMREIRPHSLAR